MVRPMYEPAPVGKERLENSVSWTAQSVGSRSDHTSAILGCPYCRRRRCYVTRSSSLLTRLGLLQRIEPERRREK